MHSLPVVSLMLLALLLFAVPLRADDGPDRGDFADKPDPPAGAPNNPEDNDRDDGSRFQYNGQVSAGLRGSGTSVLRSTLSLTVLSSLPLSRWCAGR